MNSNVVATRTAWLTPARGLGFALAFALVAGCGGEGAEEAVEIRPVRAITIESTEVAGGFSLTGRVQSQTEVNQAFRLDGQLVQREVDVGDTVKRGQLLAVLDSQNEQSALQAAEAQLVAAQAQLVDARSNFNRMRDLIVDDAVSRAAYENSEALLQVAQAQVESGESQVALARNRLNFTRLYSDVAGVVTARGPEPGEVVSAGRMIVQISKLNASDAVFDVPARVKDTSPADASIVVALTSDPSVTAEGRVREVAPRADPVTGTFQVRIELIDPPAAMRLGSTVTGRLKVAGTPGIDIPAQALFRSESATSVWVVDPETLTVSARTVEVQANDSSRVRVASGLSPGDVVVTAGVHALRPGQKVRLLEAKAP